MSLLPSHKIGVHLYEHCRVLVKDEKLVFNRKENEFYKYWAIPYGCLNVLLLGNGTSITQSAARLLADEGVMLGFVGGGGTPLFLASQSEYRPTEYFQKWCSVWFDEGIRLEIAKYFQRARCEWVSKCWGDLDDLKKQGVSPIAEVDQYLNQIEKATTGKTLQGYEGQFTKALYQKLASAFHPTPNEFKREPGKGQRDDRFNSFLDHGNYLAYGLAASALWVLGISHSMPVSHGMTRRGALVFDVADIIKDAMVLPNAFIAASQRKVDQESRDQTVAFLDKKGGFKTMLKTIQGAIEQFAGDAS